jgi:enolase-phosphatase E1
MRNPIQYYLTDIEGTTTSVSFVYDVLFPFFRQHFPDFARENAHDPVFRGQLEETAQVTLARTGERVSPEQAVGILLDWTIKDLKEPVLKSIQGAVWQRGYKSGALKGHVYPDVPPALMRCQQAGIPVGIYSSGSVEAQKMLFGSTEFGNLLPFINHHFDTAVGPKKQPKAYRNIAEQLHVPAALICFISDVPSELDAAQMSGMQTLHMVRPGTQAQGHHTTATDFNRIP